MNSFTVILLFTAVVYASAVVDPRCITPCDLTGYFTEANGYGCLTTPTQVICLCPGGSRAEVNRPCRFCNDSCNTADPRYRMCVESKQFGGHYACLCEENGVGYATADFNCNPAAVLTTRPTIATTTGGAGITCANGGALVGGYCQCPSGYSGPTCTLFNSADVCRNVSCKNNGICATRNPNGQYVAVCLCRYGTWGDYCELNGTLGSCAANPCSNGGACQENIVGATRHAYCRCQPGFSGVKCERQYFLPCTSAGSFQDTEMAQQGKYFTCTQNPNGSFRLERRSCAQGLRFNPGTQQCGF